MKQVVSFILFQAKPPYCEIFNFLRRGQTLYTVSKKELTLYTPKTQKTYVEVNLDVNTEQLDVNPGDVPGGDPRTPPAPLGLQIKNIRPCLAGKYSRHQFLYGR